MPRQEKINAGIILKSRRKGSDPAELRRLWKTRQNLSRHPAAISNMALIGSLHLSQAITAQPDPDRISQNIFQAFRDPLAPPADFQRADHSADIFSHLNPFVGRHDVFHKASCIHGGLLLRLSSSRSRNCRNNCRVSDPYGCDNGTMVTILLGPGS